MKIGVFVVTAIFFTGFLIPYFSVGNNILNRPDLKIWDGNTWIGEDVYNRLGDTQNGQIGGPILHTFFIDVFKLKLEDDNKIHMNYTLENSIIKGTILAGMIWWKDNINTHMEGIPSGPIWGYLAPNADSTIYAMIIKLPFLSMPYEIEIGVRTTSATEDAVILQG